MTAKVYKSMTLNRLQSSTPTCGRTKNGHQERRGTTAQILAPVIIIKKMKENHLTSVLCFIDFKKIFDMIYMGMIMKLLKAYDIPPNQL